MNCLTRWYVRDHNLINLQEKVCRETQKSAPNKAFYNNKYHSICPPKGTEP